MVLLAPASACIPCNFSGVTSDPQEYYHLLSDMQRLRGTIYLSEGAIQAPALTNGRHYTLADEHSWHILVLDSSGRVGGCVRYREHSPEVKFSTLGVANSALAKCDMWGWKFRSTVIGEMALSQKLGVPYVELGGWALSEELRGTTEALRMALTAYGLAQALGGGVGITTATHRNGSASILRRIGGLPLFSDRQELPPYFDPQYNCNMEVLRFYSWAPQPRFRSWVSELSTQIQDLTVITNARVDSVLNFRTIPFDQKIWREATVQAADSRSSLV